MEWLVRHHLLMSDMAQKRDIGDPRTVRDFVKAVQTQERLDLLTVLTVCDIRGVGPGTWNNWKAMLLRALWRSASDALASNGEGSRELRENEARRALRDALSPGWTAAELRAETQRHYGPYWQGLPTSAHVIFAGLLRGITPEEIRIDLHPEPERDATRACFALADHPGLFSRMTGALALVGANVVDARTYASRDGWATAIFWVQDAEGHPYEKSRLPRLRQMIVKSLKGEVIARDALQSRDKIKKRERAFRVPTSITFDNEGSEIYTIIEVDTRDRPGLLYDLTRTLADQQRLYCQRGDRDLWRTGGRHLLRQGHVRPEVPIPSRRKALEPLARRSNRARNARAKVTRSHRSRKSVASDPNCGADRADPSAEGGAILPPRPMDNPPCFATRNRPEGQHHGQPIRLIRGAMTVGLWTLLSRGAGFLRDVLMAAYLGTGGGRCLQRGLRAAQHVPPASLPRAPSTLAFVPIYARKLETAEDPDGFASDALTGLGAVVTLFALIGTLAMPWLVWLMASGFAGDARFDLAVDYGRITFVYLLFISLVAMLSGVLNAHGHFSEAGMVPVLMNLIFIAAMLLADLAGWNMGLTLAWTTPVTGIAQLAFTWAAARTAGPVARRSGLAAA